MIIGPDRIWSANVFLLKGDDPVGRVVSCDTKKKQCTVLIEDGSRRSLVYDKLVLRRITSSHIFEAGLKELQEDGAEFEVAEYPL